MLRTLSLVTMTLTGAIAASAADLTFEPPQIKAVVEEFKAKCDVTSSNFGGQYNVCSLREGTDIYIVFLTNINTGKVTRLPDAELGIELIEADGSSVIVYNPDFSGYSWMDKLPERIWCMVYTLDHETGTVKLTSKTKVPLHK